MIDLTFLELDDIYGEKKLDLLEKIGVQANASDFTIMQGIYIPEEFRNKITIGENNLYASWWTKSISKYSVVDFVDSYGEPMYKDISTRLCGARPVINNISKLNIEEEIYDKDKAITCIKFGEYPQTVATVELQSELSEKYKDGLLKETGRIFVLDNVNINNSVDPFEKKEFKEYEYNGNKYVKVRNIELSSDAILSNGKNIHPDSSYWIEVEPITWLVDKKRDLAVSKNILFTGIQFNDSNNYDDVDFENTTIKLFMDRFFKKEILVGTIYDIENKENTENTSKKINPYNFDFSEVSEEEIIKGCVEANIAVMLHGRSGDGKSARVKELDSDAEILYLINATPDSLCGKSIVNDGEMIDIPPTWYTNLLEKSEKEPDKIHIVFFDEITNAPPSIQGMAFNIILDKEINGKWKLPDNVRIVAAGNELEDSRSAHEISEPLFNRFAHVYIETNVDEWLNWASTKSENNEKISYKEESVLMKIHPAIYAFIAYKGEDALRTKFDGIKPNADPRKWELASKILYKTGKPEMLRSLVGESITKEFIMFTMQKVITLDSVLSGNYTEFDLKMNIGEKYNTAVHLSKANFEQVEIVREFIKQLGEETCALFDTLWSKGQEERLEKIQELKLSEITK